MRKIIVTCVALIAIADQVSAADMTDFCTNNVHMTGGYVPIQTGFGVGSVFEDTGRHGNNVISPSKLLCTNIFSRIDVPAQLPNLGTAFEGDVSNSSDSSVKGSLGFLDKIIGANNSAKAELSLNKGYIFKITTEPLSQLGYTKLDAMAIPDSEPTCFQRISNAFSKHKKVWIVFQTASTKKISYAITHTNDNSGSAAVSILKVLDLSPSFSKKVTNNNTLTLTSDKPVNVCYSAARRTIGPDRTKHSPRRLQISAS